MALKIRKRCKDMMKEIVIIGFVVCLTTFFTASSAAETGMECSRTEKNLDYFGQISKSRRGYVCQNWTDQFPHEHKYTPNDYPTFNLEENYCRNPSEDDEGAWCYTLDGQRWEYCDIPSCKEEKEEEEESVQLEIVTEDNVELNKEVIRGRDWSGNYEDRGDIGIIEIDHEDGWVAVRWVNSRQQHDYRVGADGKFELYYAAAGKACSEQRPCPIRDKVSEWNAWSDYSKPCGIATRKRYRTCEADSTRICMENKDETQIHHLGNCPAVWKQTAKGLTCYGNEKCRRHEAYSWCYTQRPVLIGMTRDWDKCCNEHSSCVGGTCMSHMTRIQCQEQVCSQACHKDATCENGRCECKREFTGNGLNCRNERLVLMNLDKSGTNLVDQYGASSSWTKTTPNAYVAKNGFLVPSYWHPERLSRLPQSMYVKFRKKYRVKYFKLWAGKDSTKFEAFKDFFPRRFTIFGSNDDDCLNETKWEFQMEFDQVEYRRNKFNAELDNPEFFRCYGIKVTEVRGQRSTNYTSIEKLKLYHLPVPGRRGEPLCSCPRIAKRITNERKQAVSLNEISDTLWPSNCGMVAEPRRKRIVNGAVSQVTHHPWQVQIERRESGLWKHLCGGTLIKDDVVLSAAHCFASFAAHVYSEGDYRVVTGQQFVLRTNDNQTVHEIDKIHRHRQYDDTYSNDIALITLRDPITQFHSHAQPACLPNPLNAIYSQSNDNESQRLVISGYGTTEDGSYSTQLKSANITVLSTSHCREEFRKDARNKNYANYVHTLTNLCAKDDKAGSEAAPDQDCVGDSGGPVIAQVNGKHVLVGIISWGQGCKDDNAHFPSVFTRVRCYLSWIHKTLNQDFNECG